MWPYLTVFAIGAMPAISGAKRETFARASIPFFVLLTLFIGLRHHVGMDWNNYLRMIDDAKYVTSLPEFLAVAEPTYTLLLEIGNWSGAGIYLVNVIAAAVFMYGLYTFARQTGEPWMAVVAALPLYVVVVAMSANRQALAAGILMIVVARWYNWPLWRKVAVILLAASVHASAIIFLVFVAFDLKARPAIKAAGIVVFVAAVLYLLQSTGRADYYGSAYGRGGGEELQSSGALIHVSMNAVPALAYFALPKWRQVLFPDKLMRLLAFAAMMMLPAAVIFPNAAGRISLYGFPVSIWVWGALPTLVQERQRTLVRFAICGVMFLLLYVWLNYANTAFAHIPYKNALLIPHDELEIGWRP